MAQSLRDPINNWGLRFATRLWHVAGARWFFPVVLIGFAVSAVFFAVVVFIPHSTGVVDGIPYIAKTSRVPDEFRHIGNIFYYASLPIRSGPFLTGVPDAALWLGEVERFPSYLYYYVLSFPTRIAMAAGLSHDTIVVMLRLLTAISGLASLVLARRILLAAGSGAVIAGWATLALALTGRFVWQSAGVSYDTPSMALFLLFVLAGVQVLRTASPRWYLVLIASASLVSITKYTFMPFVVFAGIALTVWVLVSRHRAGLPGVRQLIAESFARSRVAFLALSVLAFVSFGLFVERIVVNYLRFGDADPDCDVVHSVAACTTNYDIYRRNESVRDTYLAELADGTRLPQQYSPFSYTGTWADLYYQSTFFYRGAGAGMGSWTVANWVTILGSFAIIVALIAVIAVSRSLLTSPTRIFVAGLSALYVAGVYVFNLRTYLSVDRYYAHSGRYLLPIAAFAIAAALYGLYRGAQRIPASWRGIVYLGVIVLLIALVGSHNSIASFISYADKGSWFSDIAGEFMMKIARRLHD